MPEITCDGFTFDSETADVFCLNGGKGLRFQRVILMGLASIGGIAFYKVSIVWALLVGLGLIAYVYFRTAEDMQKGFYAAVVRDRICIRTGHGESTVLLKDIDRLAGHNEGYALFLKDGRRINVDGLTKDYEPIFRWMYINIKTSFKSPPRA